jgi:undecaprenyl-diphosphatase
MDTIMSIFTALLLGIIQGFTEFLPISSSGHLALAQYLLGFHAMEELLSFDIVCHVGTLLSICCVFYKRIFAATQNKTLFLQIALATLLLVPIALLSKPIASLFNRIDLLGYFFMVTAILLFSAHYIGLQRKGAKARHTWRDSLLIGAAQSLAIFPGISRSGSTISAARLIGWSNEEAVTFSFLLGMPAIAGAAALEWLKYQTSSAALAVIPLDCYIAGFFASFATGVLALLAVIQLVSKEKLHYFAWYCLAVGIFTLAIT